MKSKTVVTAIATAVSTSSNLNAASEPAVDPPTESSPMRRCKSDHSTTGMAPTTATAAATTRTRLPDRTPSTAKRNGAHAASPSPASRLVSGSSPGPGRTPQTKRRELSLNQNVEKITTTTTPNGSPRSRDNSSSLAHNNNNRAAAQQQPQPVSRATARTAGGSVSSRSKAEQPEEASCRKSSNSSQDSGIGREVRAAVGAVPRADRSSSRSASATAQQHNSGRSRSSNNNNNNNGSMLPAILTLSPEEVEKEVVSQTRARLEQLWGEDKIVELGIVRVPGTLLADLFHPGDIHTFYEVDAVPVASGLFATVRKCTHKETGVEYAAKFSSRVRCGVDCTTEVLHEIALLSICSESSKIVHLKDVFQNHQEIVLVLEYAPGGDFQSVLDDDMVPFEQDVQGFMVQLLEALSFIHQRKIAHLDIKPQNIVLMSEFPNCEIKLCDLEVSRVIQDTEQIREIIGTPDYVAPEILQLEPISLAADIWSLGVLAYVLLTGFSPFGGDTDQETLRNITTAPLDFPAELFEGVSEDAKAFIALCLDRDPLKRPTVDECFQHPWLSQNLEPPSPSPLMLKIPAPDHFVIAAPQLSVHSPSRRSCQTCRDKITERKRYLSKSREAIFEKVANSNLKKSLSKSRERLCDMRLTLSKSRDYLNESKIASRSQEKFYGLKSLSRSQEVLTQALSGSGFNKRRVNGAMSDISPAHLPMNPRIYLDTPENCDFVMLPGSSVLMSHSDLMNLSATNGTPDSLTLVDLSGRTTPASPIVEVGSCSEVHDSFPVPTSSLISKLSVQTVVEETEDEDGAEEEAEDKKRKSKMQREKRKEKVVLRSKAAPESEMARSCQSERRKSMPDAQNSRACTAKEEKDSINYETKQSMSRATSADGINQKTVSNNNNSGSRNNNNHSGCNQQSVQRSETAEVAVQVNFTRSCSSGDLVRWVREEERRDSCSPSYRPAAGTSTRGAVDKLPLLSASRDSVAGNLRSDMGLSERRLTRGFSHDDTLGEEDPKRYSWREELERFRATKKPLAVSDLIDAFSNQKLSRKVSVDESIFGSVEQLKNGRRGSLQIQLDTRAMTTLTEMAERERANRSIVKLQRRKSTSAILSHRGPEPKMPGIDENSPSTPLSETTPMIEPALLSGGCDEEEKEKADAEKELGAGDRQQQPEQAADNSNSCAPGEEVGGAVTIHQNQLLPKGRAYLEKVNERKRTWDYFEINHPKAISDKKLEQLKAKYTRRNTEACLNTSTAGAKEEQKAVDGSNNDNSSKRQEETVKSSNVGKKQGPPSRTHSMPLIQQLEGRNKLPQLRALNLAWDPLTGQSIGEEAEVEEEADESQQLAAAPAEAAAAPEREAGSRKASFWLGDHFGDLLEKIIPREEVLECFIDPFTGQFITSQVSKQSSSGPRLPDHNTSRNPQLPHHRSSSSSPLFDHNSNSSHRLPGHNTGSSCSNVKQLKVSVPNSNCVESPWSGQADDGFGSLPDTPTDFGRGSRALSQLTAHHSHPPPEQKEQYAESIPTDDGIYTSSEEVGATIPNHPPPSSVAEDYLPSSSSLLLSSSSGSSLADSGGSGSDTTSERLSVLSGEDASELGSVSDGGGRGGRMTSEAGGEEERTGSRRSAAERLRHQPTGSQRERAVATKICTGSFSRGIERFRSESPAALRGAGADS